MYSRPGFSLIWVGNLSPFTLCVYVCTFIYVCVFRPVVKQEPVLQEPWKNSSSLIQLPQQSELYVQQQARGTARSASHRFLDTGLNKEACQFRNVYLQAWFHLSVFFLLKSQSFSHMPSCNRHPCSDTQSLMCQNSSVPNLPYSYFSVMWHCWWCPANTEGER